MSASEDDEEYWEARIAWLGRTRDHVQPSRGGGRVGGGTASLSLGIRRPSPNIELPIVLQLSRVHAPSGVGVLADALQSDLDRLAAGVPFGDDRTFLLLRRVP